MNISLNRLALSLMIIGSGYSTSALAAKKVDPQDNCYWPATPGVKDHRRDVGTLWIPRDAKVGTVIGTVDMRASTADQAGLEARCANDGTALLEFEARPTAPIFSGPLDPINGEDLTGKILQTNIPGVGVRIKLNFPYDNTTGCDNCFVPVGGTPTVPYVGTQTRNIVTTIDMRSLNNSVTLVKTGNIAPGPNVLDGSELFSGQLTTLGRFLRYGMTGTIMQAQCTVGGNPVSADPVALGEWESADFTGPGYTTTAVPFSISLSNCETGTAGGFVATAHVQLDGARGSVPVGPTNSGVFSLTTDSDAEGVGVQILKADGITPIELQAEVPMITIVPGTTVMNFNARFYQTGPSSAIRPGLAKGALSFTVTYK